MSYRLGGDGAGAFNRRLARDEPLDVRCKEIIEQLLWDVADTRPALADGAALYSGSGGVGWEARLVDYASQRPGRHVASFSGPATLTPAPDSDAAIFVEDAFAPRHAGERLGMRLWRAKFDPGKRIVYCEGWGIFDTGACSDGLPLSGWGTGCGLSSDVGLVRRGEVEGGTIAHALRLVAPASCSGAFRAPARKSDQDGPGPVEMGMRLRLAASDEDIRARTVIGDRPGDLATLRALLFALRDYGAIICDGTDEHLWTFLVESRVGSCGPYSQWLGTGLGGNVSNIIRGARNRWNDGTSCGRPSDGIPWERLRVLARST